MKETNLSYLDLPEKEQKILEAAISIFAEKGYSGSTTSEIAKRAGVAEGTIFRYFKTKKDILRGILIHTISLVSSKLVLGSVEELAKQAEEKDMRWFIKKLMYDRFKLVESIFPMVRIVLTEAIYHEDVRDTVYEKIIMPAGKLFSSLYEVLSLRGLVRDDIEADAAFRSVVGNTAMIIAQKKLFAQQMPIEDMDAEFDKALDVVLMGIEKRGVQ